MCARTQRAKPGLIVLRAKVGAFGAQRLVLWDSLSVLEGPGFVRLVVLDVRVRS